MLDSFWNQFSISPTPSQHVTRSYMTDASIRNSEIVHPTIYRLYFEGLKREHEDLLWWGWVKVQDLNSCINDILSSLNIPITFRAEEIIPTFALLCKKVDSQAFVTWAWSFGYVINGVETPQTTAVYQYIYIPAGWADRIIHVVRHQIVKLTVVPHIEYQKRAPERGDWMNKKPTYFLGPFVQHQIIGHTHVGEKIVITRGEGGSTTQEAPSLIYL